MATTRFRLTKEYKQELRNMGYLDEDFEQIQQACNSRKSKFTLCTTDKQGNEVETPISWLQALAYLGMHDFLSGLSRASFHCSAVRYLNNKQTKFVSFSMYEFLGI